jgi:hypothetical protein
MLVSNTDMNIPTTTTASGNPHLMAGAAPGGAEAVRVKVMLGLAVRWVVAVRAGSGSGWVWSPFGTDDPECERACEYERAINRP